MKWTKRRNAETFFNRSDLAAVDSNSSLAPFRRFTHSTSYVLVSTTSHRIIYFALLMSMPALQWWISKTNLKRLMLKVRKEQKQRRTSEWITSFIYPKKPRPWRWRSCRSEREEWRNKVEMSLVFDSSSAS